MSDPTLCTNCHQPIKFFNVLPGKRWMHIDPNADVPSIANGTAWRHCILPTLVATPPKKEK